MDSPAPNSPNPGNPNPNDVNSLSPEDIKKLTEQLSSEIDQEIKKQFADSHGLDTQQKVNEVLKKVQEAQPKLESKDDPVIKPDIAKPVPTAQPDLSPPKNLSPENFSQASLDPLQASIQAAFYGLKENDKIGEWTLNKIYSTSFGSNKSSFYELENQAGAKWTLNPEEVKELLKTNISQSPGEPKNLAPEKPIPLKEEPQLPKPEPVKETTVEVKKPHEKTSPKNETEASQDSGLSNEQKEFLTKLHQEPKLWNLFISLKPEQVKRVQELYQKGDLDQIGIDAHPLLDQLSDQSFGKETIIKKGDTITSVLGAAGFQLSFQSSDSLILGAHVLANSAMLKQSLEKVRSSGIAVPEFPKEQDLIKLTKQGLGGDNLAYQTMITILTFLPADSKFRVFSPDNIESLSKYF